MVYCKCILMSIVKGSLINKLPITKVIVWILPPIYYVISAVMKEGRISLSILTILAIYSVVYNLIQIFIYTIIVQKCLNNFTTE